MNGSESLRPQQGQNLESEKSRARGTADLIVDDPEMPPLLSEPQHGGHKIAALRAAARRAEKPGCAND
jgi:hypothetical protein